MENNLKKEFIIDTSAFISLESIDLLKQVIKNFIILTTDSVIKELKDFSQHEDEYGIIAKRVLKFKDEFLIKTVDVEEKIKYLQDTDNELFNLSKENKTPLISDDHKIVHHTKDKIKVYFSTFFLTVFITANFITKKQGLEMLEKLRNIRNWKNNIIYLTTKGELDKL